LPAAVVARSHGQKLQDAFIPPNITPAAFQHQATGFAQPYRFVAAPPNGEKSRFGSKEPNNFQQPSQDRRMYVQPVPQMTQSGMQLFSPVPSGMVQIMGRGTPRQHMLYEPSLHAMIPQGISPNMSPAVYPAGMSQGFSHFRIPVHSAGGHGVPPGIEGPIQQPHSQYNGFHQPPNYRYNHGSMASRGGRGRGRGSMSGNYATGNYGGRKQSMGTGRGSLTANMSRDNAPNIPHSEGRREVSYDLENRKPSALPHGTERFPEYNDRDYVPLEHSDVPLDALSPGKKCFKKSIGPDVETMTSLWIGNIPLSTTITNLRKILEEKVTTCDIKPLQTGEKANASWTFFE
jgi:hypothetical protein